MSWLKSARGLKRISVRELAESIGKSQIYLKKIESGERDLPQELAQMIYEVLGFNESDAPFRTQELIDKVIELEKDSTESTVALGYIRVDKVIYFNSVKTWNQEQEIFEGDYMILDFYFAELLLQSQLVLFGLVGLQKPIDRKEENHD